MGKIDFEPEPDRRPTNQAIKAAIIGAARGGQKPPPAAPQQLNQQQRPGGVPPNVGSATR